MKKTLAALAVLGALSAGSAVAADVTLYGVVDYSLKYSRVDTDKTGEDATNKFEMASGAQSGSRFGLKGTEDLGNGLKVGFVLENGFGADDGTMLQGSRLFGRESQVYLAGAFGQLSFGRVGQLVSGNGSYGLMGDISPFGASWAGAVEPSTYMVGYGRFDNTVTYKSPEFAGARVYAQYSFNANNKDEWKQDGLDDTRSTTEGKTTANRYAALGATYNVGGLALVAAADWYNWSDNWDRMNGADWNHVEGKDSDDGYTFTLAGSYNFQVVKAYLSAQYFDNMYRKGSTEGDALAAFGEYMGNDQFKGYGVIAGVSAPIAGGLGMFAVGYTDAEDCDKVEGANAAKTEVQRFGASIGYDYSLSKRTNVYTVLSYAKDKLENEGNEKGVDRDPNTTTWWVGMRHKF